MLLYVCFFKIVKDTDYIFVSTPFELRLGFLADFFNVFRYNNEASF